MFGHGRLAFQIGQSFESQDAKLQLSLGSSPGTWEANVSLYKQQTGFSGGERFLVKPYGHRRSEDSVLRFSRRLCDDDNVCSFPWEHLSCFDLQS